MTNWLDGKRSSESSSQRHVSGNHVAFFPVA
jgi:hypothetical protein